MKIGEIKVELIDSMSSDLGVVNAARVSFEKESKWIWEGEHDNEFSLSKADANLIRYLASGLTSKEKQGYLERITQCNTQEDAEALFKEIRRVQPHELCFAHAMLQFRVTAPLAIARQLWKSHIGLASQDESLGWNEVSRRYVSTDPEFYMPEWRKAAANVKQGSSSEVAEVDDNYVKDTIEEAQMLYANLVHYEDVAPETSRFVLPQGTLTTWIWTGSLLAFSRICKLRIDAHAQKEAQLVAQQIATLAEPLFPHSWAALMDN